MKMVQLLIYLKIKQNHLTRRRRTPHPKLANKKNNQKAQVFQFYLFLLYTITDTSLPLAQQSLAVLLLCTENAERIGISFCYDSEISAIMAKLTLPCGD